jgi:hypothetical protein
MRKVLGVVGVLAMLCLAAPGALAKTPPASKSSSATIVIVFKDGHQQSFNLSDISRVEFPVSADAAGQTASAGSLSSSKGRFLGRWEVGDGTGNNFFITLHEDGTALRSMGNVRGKWIAVDGEAHVIWDDGAQDAIRKVGSNYQKFAYGMGKSFTDTADNVTNAHNTTPHPI